MEWYLLGALVVAVLLGVLLLGVPLWAGIALTSFVFLATETGFLGAISTFATLIHTKLFNYLLITIPLFVLMAEIIMFSGIGSDLYEMMHTWLRSLHGGLAMSSTASCAVFGAMCGVTSPTVAAIGLVAIPEMLKRGYDKRLATGSVAAAGGLATLIPPSVPMILYAFVVGESVGRMFIAGVIPGIILTTMMMGSIWVRVRMNPSLAITVPAASWGERFTVLRNVLPVATLVFLVLVSIYIGVATPTEAAGVGAVGALLIAVVKGKVTASNMEEALLRTVRVTSFIFMVIFAALLFGYMISYLGVTQKLASWVVSLPVSKYVVLLALQLTYLLLGCFLDQGAIILITTPVVYPIITQVGFDPVWYGILLVVNMEAAGITPPVGFNLYVARSVAPEEVTLLDVIRGALPFLIVELIFLLILVLFPDLALWLPSTMFEAVPK